MRADLVQAAHADEVEGAPLAAREVLANQILDDDPPATWATAKRLLDAGFDRHDVLTQLSLAFLSHAEKMIGRQQPFDPQAWVALLDQLPLPTAGDLAEAVVEIARERPGIDADQLTDAVLERAGRGADDDLARQTLEHVEDHLLGEDGPLTYLAPDRVVHVGDLTAGIVLTHRLSWAERKVGVVTAGADLAGFRRLDDLHLPDGTEVEPFSVEPGHLGWDLPDEWFEPFPDRRRARRGPGRRHRHRRRHHPRGPRTRRRRRGAVGRLVRCRLRPRGRRSVDAHPARGAAVGCPPGGPRGVHRAAAAVARAVRGRGSRGPPGPRRPRRVDLVPPAEPPAAPTPRRGCRSRRRRGHAGSPGAGRGRPAPVGRRARLGRRVRPRARPHRPPRDPRRPRARVAHLRRARRRAARRPRPRRGRARRGVPRRPAGCGEPTATAGHGPAPRGHPRRAPR
ncbi:MAG: hypothetical protein U5R31_00740 [Acidimicrobiia bacterium]|nr:hypothetical protein [Acidimicrobiia bacterium]